MAKAAQIMDLAISSEPGLSRMSGEGAATAQPDQVRRPLVHRTSGATVGHAVLPRGTLGLQGLLLVPTSTCGAWAGEVDPRGGGGSVRRASWLWPR